MRLASVKWITISMLVLMFFGFTQLTMSQLGKGPQVDSVTVAQIQKLQSDQTQRGRFVIIDVRSKAETDVSVIPGALTKSEFEKSANQHQGKTIVVYCTIGVRSGKYAAELNRKGWQALNYKGSILDWCQNKLPLQTPDGKRTNRVHTYSARYSVPQEYTAVH